jgi:hypothetical protein
MPPGPLLPSVEELRELSERAQVAAINAGDRVSRRKFAYAITSLIGGLICFLAMLGGFVFLVMQGRPESAGLLLGTGLLAIIGRMIGARLKSD